MGPPSLVLPVVVAGADGLVAVEARRDAEALPAALLAEEHARLVVLRLAAPPTALRWALCGSKFTVRLARCPMDDGSYILRDPHATCGTVIIVESISICLVGSLLTTFSFLTV